MRILAAVPAGAGLSVVLSALVLGLTNHAERSSVLGMFVLTAVFVGPGALLLAVPLSLWLARLHRRGASLARRGVLGAVAGIPLMGLHFAAVAYALELQHLGFFRGGSVLWLAGGAVAAGAGLGLGCALGTLPRREETA